MQGLKPALDKFLGDAICSTQAVTGTLDLTRAVGCKTEVNDPHYSMQVPEVLRSHHM